MGGYRRYKPRPVDREKEEIIIDGRTYYRCDKCKEVRSVEMFLGGFVRSQICEVCKAREAYGEDGVDKRLKQETDQRRAEREAEQAAKLAKSALKRDKYMERSNRKFNAREKRERAKARIRKQAQELANAKRLAKIERKKLDLAKRELASRALAKRHLLPFIVRHMADYKAGWVHKEICAKLEQFAEDIRKGKSPRLMIQMPPRTGKSEIASVNFPAWFLGNNPEMEIIAASYGVTLAEEFSRKVRGIVRSAEYKAVFSGSKLDPDNQNASGWRTTKGGGYLPGGVGTGLTGKGCHCLIIDDPIKNMEEADSEAHQEKVWEWYGSTAYTRLAPGGGVLVIQTLWSDNDLSKRLEREMEKGTGDQWEILRYPAIATEDETYRRKGEALHPERYDRDALAKIKNAVGPRVWEALYQQNPVAEEGGYFMREHLKWYSGEAPKRLHIYSAWDLAIGKGDRNDYTVGITVGIDENDDMWILDMRRGRWDSFEIVEQIMDVHHTYKPNIIGIERGQIQMAIGPYLEQRIAEDKAYDMVVQDLPTGRRDKEARARAIQGRIRQGKVLFPTEKWVDDLVDEMMRFPFGVHDDCVDALAWVGLMLQDMDHPLEMVYPQSKDRNGWRAKILRTLTGVRGSRKKSMMTS